MSYRTIIVYVESGSDSGTTIQAAVALAREHEAKLVGVTAGFPRPPMYYDGFGVVTDLIAMERDQIEADMKRAEEQFHKATDGTGLKIEWRKSMDFPVKVLVRAANQADLVLVGRSKGVLSHDPFASVSMGDLLMSAGRPVLLLSADETDLNLHNVVIGWKNTREARRAIADALPMLKRAKEVRLIQIGGSPDDDAPRADAASFLGSHRIKVRTEVVKARGDGAGNQLSQLALDTHSDLVVAGAYGHSRLREWVFGGVTKHLLEASPASCLLSH